MIPRYQHFMYFSLFAGASEKYFLTIKRVFNNIVKASIKIIKEQASEYTKNMYMRTYSYEICW